ncbi:DUF4166 domain-containing protein [Bosea sp. BK604]|uniref:DUF4166 domain-containing protein n=1 Tax=Bosea sp. BK604 TaxID=2512180 RepID=UPI0010D1B08E|nr:DUF4166 domain-containing protein [Bosea sp. BK604]TCR59333.1 saccharopine dehydrogenase-like NADP-dependent oxidoreductase [Bosea sp. BK604]
MKILLLGGYGGFGARIARRLASAGHEVLVGGRNREKAERFCAQQPGLVPLVIDRDNGLSAALAEHRPVALIDAAGPFQGAGYDVARACIAAGCHYLDIADGRDFVAGIGALDEAARAAGVAVIAGASSVPALSGAAVRELAAGMERVSAVEMAISASNRATAGPSVTRAIFSYIGKPIPLRRGRRETTGHGWQDLQRIDFTVASEPPLRGRIVGLVDVPDLSLMPDRLPGKPAVSFRAGTEMAWQNLMLWLASWPVRWGLLDLTRFVPPVLRAQKLTAGLGSDRSGMIVRLFGFADGKRVERRWTLIAKNGDGPEIPGLAAAILVDRLATGSIAPGARDAGELLTLAEFEPAFSRLAIRHETTELPQPPALYERVLGSRFAGMPDAVRAMHGVLRDDGASGRGTVTRGKSPLARLVAALFGFPAEGEHALHVSFNEQDGVEAWTRDFSGKRFRSELSQDGEFLVEHFGLLRFGFHLAAGETGLAMHLKRWWLGRLPLPLALAPRSLAREWQEDGRFHFDSPIALPLIGLVVHYRGWLEPRSK